MSVSLWVKKSDFDIKERGQNLSAIAFTVTGEEKRILCYNCQWLGIHLTKPPQQIKNWKKPGGKNRKLKLRWRICIHNAYSFDLYILIGKREYVQWCSSVITSYVWHIVRELNNVFRFVFKRVYSHTLLWMWECRQS